jgi:hypothetical protein
MNPWVWVVVVLAILVIAGAAGYYYITRRRSQLRSRFGTEYDNAVREYGNRWRAEQHLLRRERRVERLQIRTLPPDDRQRFADEWRACQALFVDNPREAVSRADRLVGEVMKARGYPVANFEQRVEDISVDHPAVVQNYRAARAIAERHERGEASTEDLRKAVVFYRALFEELLGAPVHEEVHR